MKHRIMIERIEPDVDVVKIYEQIVEDIDLRAVMAAVNQRPRKPRKDRGGKKGEVDV